VSMAIFSCACFILRKVCTVTVAGLDCEEVYGAVVMPRDSMVLG